MYDVTCRIYPHFLQPAEVQYEPQFATVAVQTMTWLDHASAHYTWVPEASGARRIRFALRCREVCGRRLIFFRICDKPLRVNCFGKGHKLDDFVTACFALDVAAIVIPIVRNVDLKE